MTTTKDTKVTKEGENKTRDSKLWGHCTFSAYGLSEFAGEASQEFAAFNVAITAPRDEPVSSINQILRNCRGTTESASGGKCLEGTARPSSSANMRRSANRFQRIENLMRCALGCGNQACGPGELLSCSYFLRISVPL